MILAMCKHPWIGLLQKISCILGTAQTRFVIVITIIAVKEFKWLQSVGVTMSYRSIHNFITRLGENHDKKVLEWCEKIET